MGQKSAIEKLPAQVRNHIEKRLREDRLTLDGLIADLREHFPDEKKPSRTALGRYSQKFDAMVEKLRDQENLSRMIVGELGENPDDRAGALMVQTLSMVINDSLADASEKEMKIADICKLARATKDAIQARTASLKERQAIEKAAREKLLEEQKEKLAAMPVKGGVTEETKQAIREALGIV